MKRFLPPKTRWRQRGVAAVELALIMLFTFFVLPVVFLFGRVFYHYNVLKQATEDAATYMASVPRLELRTSQGMANAKARAVQMVVDAVAASGITPPEDLVVDVRCNNGGLCGPTMTITDIEVLAMFALFDGFWQYTSPWLTDEYGTSWTFNASSVATFRN